MKKTFAIAVHGGAGRLPFWGMTSEREKEFSNSIKGAVQEGYYILENGGGALDAVEVATKYLEDDELFNAGKGSVFTTSGKIRMDASIMCGKTQNAGAACLLKKIKNPVSLARKIMESSENLFLSGAGAEQFAKQMKLEFEKDNYFFSKERYEQWEYQQKEEKNEEHGTVGAVALDLEGNLAAATSTGGLIGKNDFRIGDTPIIGAGTYAKNETCAVSCTGKGESIIRAVASHSISCMLEYQKITLEEACEKMMLEKLIPFGGHAGLIALDRFGNFKCVHNSERMYRGYKVYGQQIDVRLY